MSQSSGIAAAACCARIALFKKSMYMSKICSNLHEIAQVVASELSFVQ